MAWLTIGAFARAARLSPKALRLYDQLGLLLPVHVDPVSGYRFYDPAQLERARLVAWLRRIGMPLARIRVVCDLDPVAAAEEVAAYWARVEADTATRRDLATFLIGYLSGKDTVMSGARRTLGFRYAARSDTGLVRDSNQDAVYAGARLLAVADGLGHPGGELASAAVIEALRPLDADASTGDLLNSLEDAVQHANETLHTIVESDPTLDGMGTTLTAMLWSGAQLALVHIGDTRAYLLRDGELFQTTHDHTFVQSLVDEGQITADEAASHPRRSLLLRALDGRNTPAPDLSLHDAEVGDRYLLCSDGLSTVVDAEQVQHALGTIAEPEHLVRRLVDLANQRGGPDNIACVVADVIPL